MTIIAGFPIKKHVVLGADTEEGGDYARSSVQKIATLEGPDYKILIGGSGDADFIDFAVQESRRRLGGVKSAVTLDGCRELLEAVVTEIYTDRIDTFPVDQQEKRSFDLLCALWTKDAGEAQLVKVDRAVSLVRDRPEALGIGSYLARYLIETLKLRVDEEFQQVRHTERLCAYILSKVKAHVKDCGGLSQIMVLYPDGHVRELTQGVIRIDEESSDLVMSGAVKWLFTWADPVGWQANAEKLDEVVDRAAGMAKRDLREYLTMLRPPADQP